MKKIILSSCLVIFTSVGFAQNNQTITDCCLAKKPNILINDTSNITAIILNSSKSLLEFGAIGDGIFDNTTAIINAIAWSSANAEPVIVPKGVFITNIINLKDCVHFIGLNRDSSIFRKKPGNDCQLLKTPESITVKNISFESMTIDGGVRYLKHSIDPAADVKDENPNHMMLGLAFCKNVSFYNVHFTGAENGIFFYSTDSVNIKKCIIDNIGGNFIATNYQQNITNITLDENKFLSFGCRDKLDPIYTNQYRFGDAALSAGGSNWTISNNYFFNGANTKWAWMEGRFTENVIVRDNVFDGNGRNCFGVTITSPNDSYLVENVYFLNNTFKNIVNDSQNDEYVNGTLKYEFPHYYEFYKIKNAVISGNKMPNSLFEISWMKNVTFEKNEIKSSNFRGQQVIRIGGNGGQDSVENIKIINNTIEVTDGFLSIFNCHQNSASIKNITITNNTLSSGANYFILISKLQVDTSERMENIQFFNNNLSGTNIYHIFQLYGSAVDQLLIEGNDFIATGLTKVNAFDNTPTMYQAGNTRLTIQNNSYTNADDVPPGFSLVNYTVGEDLIGTINGANKEFTLPSTPTTGKATIILNGQLQHRGTNYMISENIVSLTIAPIIGSILKIAYFKP